MLPQLSLPKVKDTRARVNWGAMVSAVLLLSGVTITPAAQAQVRHGVIRDAEIEALLKDYAAPIFSAAGIAKGSIKIALIDDRSFNAFVTTGRRMFVNIGALMESKSPNEIIGVIAHEAGHIAGGHLTLQRERAGMAAMMATAGVGSWCGSHGRRGRQP